MAPQRILLLTLPQVVSTVGSLLGEAAADYVRSSPEVRVATEPLRRFPAGGGEDAVISADAVVSRDQVGQAVGRYVGERFAEVTRCVPASDPCALDFLNVIAARAYRRAPTAAEGAALKDLYGRLSEQQVNGYQVTATVEEATQYALYALVTSPQLLWRYEVGGQGATAAAPTVHLTDDELATAVSFFLTDGPPDDALLAAARGGTLQGTLAEHVARILDSEAARGWLRSVMEMYFELNQLPAAEVGSAAGFTAEMTKTILSDMGVESRMFLDQALWRGELSDLVKSRATFLNARLAEVIYGVPVPAAATDTAFVATILPGDRRAGLLTNAGFLTTRARDGRASVGGRGQRAAAALLCLGAPALTAPGPVAEEEASQRAKVDATTAQQQVAARRKSECLACHATMDAVGVVLDGFDGIGRDRAVDAWGQPVDTRTPLPPVLGTGPVAGAAAMAEAIGRSSAFASCMARAVLEQAMSEPSPALDVSLSPQQEGCAVADVAARFNAGQDKTFAALVRATAASPAFVLRTSAP